MRIGIFSDTYEPHVNGVVTSIKTLKEHLEAEGHKVFIVTSSDSFFRFELGEDILRIPGLRVKALYDHRLTSIYSIRAMMIIKSWNLDIIHTHTEFGIGTFSRFVSAQLNIPIVYTYHTMYEEYVHYILPGKLMKKSLLPRKMVVRLSGIICNISTKVIVPTQKVKNALLNYGVKREITVIPTGINLNQFSLDESKVMSIKHSLGIEDDDIVAIFVGRLAKEKNIAFILEALVSNIKENKRLKFLVVGSGPSEPELKALSVSLGISDNVIFVGEVAHSDIQNYYAISDIFVSASKSETQGLTIIEAMASSKPVLVYNDPSYYDAVIHNKTGFLFNTKEELASQLRLLTEDAEFRYKIGRTAKEYTKKYSCECFYDKIINVYTEAINNNNERRTKRIFQIRNL